MPNMHQNMFGGRAQPYTLGGAYTLPRPYSRTSGVLLSAWLFQGNFFN